MNKLHPKGLALLLALLAVFGLKDLPYARRAWAEATGHHILQDYTTYYYAGQAAAVGASPYNTTGLGALKQRAGVPDRTTVIPAFIYSPVSLLLYQPLAWLPYSQAFDALFALNLLAHALSAWLFYKVLSRQFDRRAAAVVAVGLWLSPLYFYNLLANQANILVLFGLMSLLYLTVCQPRGLVIYGAALGGFAFACGLKIFVAAVAAYPMLAQRRVLVGGLVAGASLVGMALAIYPAHYSTEFFTLITHPGGYFELILGQMSPISPTNLGINGFFANLGQAYADTQALPMLQNTVFYGAARGLGTVLSVVLVAVCLAAAWLGYRQVAPRRVTLIDVFYLPLVGYFLCSPLFWRIHLLLLLPYVLYLLLTALSTIKPKWVLLAGCLLFLTGAYHNVANAIPANPTSRADEVTICLLTQWPTMLLTLIFVWKAWLLMLEVWKGQVVSPKAI